MGVFVQETFRAANNDDSILLRTKRRAANLHRKKMELLFKGIKDQHDGSFIGLSQFRQFLSHKEINTWLAAMDYDATDPELISGMASLKGTARNVDLKVLLKMQKMM